MQFIRVTKEIRPAQGKGPRKQVCGLFKAGSEMPQPFTLPLWDADEPVKPGDYTCNDFFYVGGTYRDQLMINARDTVASMPAVTK